MGLGDEELCHRLPCLAVVEARGQEGMEQDGCQHGLDPWIAEAQCGHPAFVDDHRLMQFIEGRRQPWRRELPGRPCTSSRAINSGSSARPGHDARRMVRFETPRRSLGSHDHGSRNGHEASCAREEPAACSQRRPLRFRFGVARAKRPGSRARASMTDAMMTRQGLGYGPVRQWRKS